jgi:integrase
LACSELQRWQGWLDERDYDVAALQDDGDRIMRRYAQRVDAGGLAASTATTYWAYLSGFLSYAVRDGLLDRNPALAERATEELPSSIASRIYSSSVFIRSLLPPVLSIRRGVRTAR